MVEAPTLHRALLALIVLGLALSIYAALEVWVAGLSSACSVNSVISCSQVLRSGHTSFPPGTFIPDWAWGVGGFLALLVIDVALLQTYDVRLLWAVVVLSALGVVVAVSLGYIEVFVIHAICPVCVSTYAAGVGVFVISAYLLKMRRAADLDLRSATEPSSGTPST
ncbi:MAG: vitamin K epoxide reductase family protein [Thermoplasmata archaeon]